MIYGAIIEKNKVTNVVHVTSQKAIREDITIVDVDLYKVQIGDDYIDGKFYRKGEEIIKQPSLEDLRVGYAELKAKVSTMEITVDDSVSKVTAVEKTLQEMQAKEDIKTP
jgi:hypothetical protein